MTWPLALLLAFAGLMALAPSQPRHHAAALGGPVPPRRRAGLRVAGALLVGGAASVCVAGFGCGPPGHPRAAFAPGPPRLRGPAGAPAGPDAALMRARRLPHGPLIGFGRMCRDPHSRSPFLG